MISSQGTYLIQSESISFLSSARERIVEVDCAVSETLTSLVISFVKVRDWFVFKANNFCDLQEDND